jgi:hypothetical protein
MAKIKEEIKEYKPTRYKNRYYISNLGKFYYNTTCWRNPDGEFKELIPSYNPSGYLYYKLSIGNCKYDYIRAHRAVYQSFIGKIPKGKEIDHIDNNRHNNNISNLRAVTHSENCLNKKIKCA